MKQLILLLITLFYFICSSCTKFLDEKSDAKLRIPESPEDLQALLDNFRGLFNEATVLNNICADEYYLKDSDWQSLTNVSNKEGYIWTADVQGLLDWETQYRTLFYANTVLESISNVQQKHPTENLDPYYGAALFFRAHVFYNLSQLFTPAYEKAKAQTDLGVPLRLTTNFNKPSNRATLQQTYDQMVSDLLSALEKLPSTPLYKTRPGKAAGYGLLSRIYLSMQDYEKAKQYADSCLTIHHLLIDYNTIAASATNPFLRFNDEVIFHTNTGTATNTDRSRAKVDSNLLKLYDSKDLRLRILFRSNADGSYHFKGSYNGSLGLFNGIATDEVLLTRAECSARLNHLENALKDINELRRHRFAAEDFVPIAINNQEDLLQFILDERRRELVYRGTRWMDLRRLNLEDSYKQTLVRKIKTDIFMLPPNDLRYTLLIPDDVIALSGIEQNKR